MSAIIQRRPDFDWDPHILENLAELLQVMNETLDESGDPFYDYTSMAHWVLNYLEENKPRGN